ncbi:DUF488 domain-containing protein [Streptomyces tibetensis]|uniref:DUF488 domain-containing protein n=1 Tax=Streptomyces tibetensis TaxID=2382123 RepID=UPI0033D72237
MRCAPPEKGYSETVDTSLVTFGHSTAGRDRIGELLRDAGVRAVVDVRTAPGSRRDPDLLREAGGARTAVMCSEAVWWRCHRRLIADFAVLARGVPARHLMHDGRLSVHAPTPGARLRDDGLLVYDAPTGPPRG